MLGNLAELKRSGTGVTSKAHAPAKDPGLLQDHKWFKITALEAIAFKLPYLQGHQAAQAHTGASQSPLCVSPMGTCC